MDKSIWALLLVGLSLLMWYAPQWNGAFFAPSLDVTSGDGRIAAAIFFVGALVLWYLPTKKF